MARELGDVAHHVRSLPNWQNDTDEEFCIIDAEDGMGLYPKDGIPEIRWLTNDSVRLIDNHFTVPVGNYDMFLL